MTTEEKFSAAVNVIRSLPKNGSYQPSNDLMLRFYGFFKQATQGPCSGPRPAFWDVVGRAKYDAWKKLGDMSKKDAMTKYVDELHSIVETMSYSEKVANFLEAPTSELDSINLDDLELIAGDVLERVRSQPNSPLGSREASPVRFATSIHSSSPSLSSSPPPEESDHSDEEYIDTIENPEPKKALVNGISLEQSDIVSNGFVQHTQHAARARTRSQSNIDISQEISKAVQSLKADIDRLSVRINSLEHSSTKSTAVAQKAKIRLGNLSPNLILFLFAWPFLASFIVNRFLIRK